MFGSEPITVKKDLFEIKEKKVGKSGKETNRILMKRIINEIKENIYDAMALLSFDRFDRSAATSF